MTPEEIEVALVRAGAGGGEQTALVPAGQQNATVAGAQYRPALPAGAPPGYGYGYAQQQLPPPDLPRRDWRDWFIMATTVAGVGYGVYSLSKKYIAPLIAPPTPPQLQQDKESIDEQFSRAFALIDQLAADTTALKHAEETRADKLDTALKDVESVTSDLKLSSRRRDEDIRRISEEIRTLKDGIPKAIEGERKGYERRLTELGAELKSLKVLLSNRLAAPPPPHPQQHAPAPMQMMPAASSLSAAGQAQVAAVNAAAAAAMPGPVARAQAVSPGPGAASGAGPAQQDNTPGGAAGAGVQRSATGFGKPASIPAWQMAAANKGKSASVSEEGGAGGAGSS
ncbi:peroxisomal membrane protein pex14 [Ascosphaera pollenicola]|nr:peroxisomal membrane protein pex14 [Ascosphaera pollenicola]